MSNTIRTLLHTAAAYIWWGVVAGAGVLRVGRIGKPRSPAKRMLLLAWRLPPSVTGGVYRPCSFLKCGPENGWEISAVAGPPELAAEGGQWLLERLPESTTIHRSRETRLRPGWRWFPRINGGFLNGLNVAALAYRVCRKQPPSVVLASGPPFHNFVAAHHIARYFGAKLVLDYRDEWSVGTRDFVSLGNADRKWEAFCLERADSVIFVTQSFQDIYLETFPALDSGKTHVVTNGWDGDDFAALDGPDEETGEQNYRYTIAYIGRAGRFDAPEGFFSALDQLFRDTPELHEKLRIRFVGRQFPELHEALAPFAQAWPGVVEMVGEVSKPAALEAMKESSCLLLFNTRINERRRPGKLYEYVASGTPLLAFGTGREIGGVVSRLNLGPVVPEEQPQALHDALTELMAGKWQSRHCTEVDRWLARHTRQALAADVFNTATALIDGRVQAGAEKQWANNR